MPATLQPVLARWMAKCPSSAILTCMRDVSGYATMTHGLTHRIVLPGGKRALESPLAPKPERTMAVKSPSRDIQHGSSLPVARQRDVFSSLDGAVLIEDPYPHLVVEDALPADL